MPLRIHRRRSGFTLTELAIVLAVVGVLSAGLWNLISGANEQVRDAAAASQQGQLVSAVGEFLASAPGQQFMTTNAIVNGCGGNCAANKNFPIPLPATNLSVANCATNYADANLKQFCAYLPPGFTSATINSYGQTFKIQVLRDGTGPGQPPGTYSFMVMASGVVIPDTSGARIASLIGGDGGFVYSAPTCTAAASSITACGAFGGWTATLTGGGPGGYGFAAGAFGAIASRTYVTPQQNSFFSWLARIPIAGDTNFSLNSMTTPEYLGGFELDMGSFASPMLASGGGAINLQGGTINFGWGATAPALGFGIMNMEGGAINMADPAVGGGLIQGYNGSNIALVQSLALGPLVAPYNNFIQLSPGCTADTFNVNVNGLAQNSNCAAGIQVAGDAKVLGRLSANSLYSLTFIYDSGGIVSDMRLKTNIQPIHNAIDDVQKLKPVTFKLKSNGKPSMGFLAQDIEKIYPDLVLETDEGYKAVNYSGLIAPLVSAVQELKQQNADLRQKLDEQAKSEQALRSEVDALKAVRH